MENFGIFSDNLTYIKAIWYIVFPFGKVVVILYIFPVLVNCVKKYLATLVTLRPTHLVPPKLEHADLRTREPRPRRVVASLLFPDDNQGVVNREVGHLEQILGVSKSFQKVFQNKSRIIWKNINSLI
jgi:hypothetical protein